MPPISHFTSAEVAERWAKSARECDAAINAINEQIDAAHHALLAAGMRSEGSIADRITRLATQRDAAILLATLGVGNSVQTVSERCPTCGYTEFDAIEMGDHDRCSQFPEFAFERNTTQGGKS